MYVTVNGEKKEFDDELTIVGLLKAEDVEYPDMVSVQLNGTILARKTFPTTTLSDGDSVEFLYFMGGGASAILDMACHIENCSCFEEAL